VVDPAATSGAEVLALPSSGEVLADVRGDGRWMRVTWHEEVGLVVLSLWRQSSCVGTLRLDRAQVPALVSALVEGLAAGSTGLDADDRAPRGSQPR
jgi:hypothetical protein